MDKYSDYFLNYLQTEKYIARSAIRLEKHLVMSLSNCAEAEL